MSKFESESYALRYERAVACILKASRGYHVHIGDLSDAFLQKIHEELDAENVSHDQFIHIPWVASLSQALIENAVDVYVSSFPLGGGKSLIEAMSVGVPVVTHESYRSRYHAGSDLAYPDSFTWSQYEELGRIFKQWDEPLLKWHAASASQHFERYYSQDAFLKAFASGLDSAALVPPLHAYHRNQLQNHLDIKRQRVQEIGHLISEKNRMFEEWMKVDTGYKERCATITELQAVIEQLTQEKLALEVSVMAQRQNEGTPRSWKGKIRKIAAVILDK